MAENRQASGPGLVQEACGVLGIFVALFLLICLVGVLFVEPGQNGGWGGSIGRFTATALVSFLGMSSGWLVTLLLVFAVSLFSPSFSLERLPWIAAGSGGIILATSGLLSLIHNGFSPQRSWDAGGVLGSVLAGFIVRFFGGAGAVLFFLAVLSVSAMAALRLSPSSLARRARALLFRESTEGRDTTTAAPGRRKRDDDGQVKDRPAAGADHLPMVREPVKTVLESEAVEEFRPKPAAAGTFQLPALSLLDLPEAQEVELDREHYFKISGLLEAKLRDFGVEGKVVGISPGPVITTYEFSPAPGVKINKIVSLADDLALGLKAQSVRIVGSIPGKAALGIEIPNPQRQIVHLREILGNDRFQKSTSRLTLGLGKDVIGHPVTADLAKMPHLLIAGATGAGKSVAINTIICSMLFKATPEEVRLLLVDPKRIELSVYEDIPHLLHPVVVDPRMASRALQWAVREMERRYALMEELRVKSIAGYNEAAAEKLPLIVIIIDELADLMMVSSKEVEDAVARLAQMARAAGMHLILATQRPSVDVLTGLIKANFPTRMSFKVSAKTDSRTILDMNGAEHLLGAGDMLFLAPGTSRLQRIHGAYISEKETERIIGFLKGQGKAVYDESVMRMAEAEPDEPVGEDEYDEKWDEAVALVCESGQASISMLQRRLRVGYNRAARMIELMEREGLVGPADGAKPREVLARRSYDD
ncbi:MAG: DNA translocase FtsK 4TM domain-containing protein [Thermodesulfobacteriota bacterium]